ncbi:MAG TPA: response regulator [Chloroflexota bacterium]|nr:response regulator [Chloroflexota bacterium]
MATILVADDERAIRLLLEMILSDGGHRVLLAADGRQALERSERDRPDLVIADVMMPVLDGAALCRQLKAGVMTARLPVILMSAAAESAARAAGADAFLRKPFDVAEVESLVQRLLPTRSTEEVAGS